MKQSVKCGITILSFFLFSCSNKPSEKDISKKILLEYVCAETARVNDLKILKTEEVEELPGVKAYSYSVTGEVEWPNGCSDFGSNTAKGTKEKFEKTVMLAKSEDGKWQ